MSHEGNGLTAVKATRIRCASASCRRSVTIFAASKDLIVAALRKVHWSPYYIDDGDDRIRWLCPRCKEDA